MGTADGVPAGFRSRAATLEDAPAIADLINEVNIAEVGMPWTSVEEVRDDLTSPESGAWQESVVLLADGGTLSGFLQVWSSAPPFTEIQHMAFVHPELWGRGLTHFCCSSARSARERTSTARRPVSESCCTCRDGR